jgi:iron complex transport system permease protein
VISKPPIIFTGFALLLLLAIIASLALGEAMLSPAEILSAIRGTSNETSRIIIFDIRIPRTIVGASVGAALGASGAVMQAYFRNPLASPGLLGVSSGGGLGAVIAIVLFNSWFGVLTIPMSSIAGAFMATGAVMLLARRGASLTHLLLAGIALNAMFGAATSFLLAASTLRPHSTGAEILFWLMGGIENRTWEHVWMAAPGILLTLILLLPLRRSMNLLALGDSGAQSLGVNVRRLRVHLILISTVLTALATAVGGVIGFVGLVVPHIIRLMDGPDNRRLIPLSMLGGASLVLLCDLLTRFLASGMRLGIITSLVGGPFLLWLLRKRPC